jgi:hypothetical protein
MSKSSGKTFGYTIALALVCLAGVADAQSFEIFGGVGYASYSHQSLRDFQQYEQTHTGVRSTIVQKFPAYYTYMGGFNISFTKWMFTGEIGHGSTGGRVYYQDYSGRMTYDLLVTYTYYAAGASYYLYKTDGLSVTLGAKILIVPTKLAVKNSITIGSQSDSEAKDFYGSNFGMQPNIALRKYFGPLFLQASAGYELQTSQFPESKGDNLQLNNGSGGQVDLQGSGFRLALCAGLRMKMKKAG